MKGLNSIFEQVTSNEALFAAWGEFKRGKMKRRDVQEFWRNLEKNIFHLHRDLRAQCYRHASYASFFIQDPKVRHIRKACVRDRVVHQTVYTYLTGLYEPLFIHHLYSSRIAKGTHRAVNSLQRMTLKVSRNLTRPCWALKCDIRKFYDTVDHELLLNLLKENIGDPDVIWLLREIIKSFHVEGTPGKGLPIGNLTSQILTSIYLNEFDQFMKHQLRARHYIRFADDFVILSQKKRELEEILPRMKIFLSENLYLEFHPHKVVLRPLRQGIDFLGYVTLPHHRVLRTKTRRRMKRKLRSTLAVYFKGEVPEQSLHQSMQSYLGLLKHADTYKLQDEMKNAFCWR